MGAFAPRPPPLTFLLSHSLFHLPDSRIDTRIMYTFYEKRCSQFFSAKIRLSSNNEIILLCSTSNPQHSEIDVFLLQRQPQDDPPCILLSSANSTQNHHHYVDQRRRCKQSQMSQKNKHVASTRGCTSVVNKNHVSELGKKI